MRILFISHEGTSKDSAIGIVLGGIKRELINWGHTVDILGPKEAEDVELEEHYDVMHCGWLGLLPTYPVEIPVTLNLWNIPLHRAIGYHGRMLSCPPTKIVVDDVYTIQTLGQLNMHNYVRIPLAFDLPGQIPPPDGPFTVGVFGNDYRLQEPCQLVDPQGGSFEIQQGYSTKRFGVAEEACKRAKVEYYPCIQDSGRKNYLIDPVEDVYSQIHTLVHTSVIDTNSMPVREALACGRPVIATRNDGLQRIIMDGVNGLFFDGSVKDLQMKIAMIKANYKDFSNAACCTVPELTVTESAMMYERMWEECIAK